jgi:peroxiredoxin
MFTLKTPDGDVYSLKDHLGKATIVTFWGTTCGGCGAEARLLIRLYYEHSDDGLNVVGVNLGDGPEAVRQFVKYYGVPYPMVMNGTGEQDMRKAYGVTTIPMNYVVGASGKVLARFEGWDKELVTSTLRNLGISD